MIENAIICEGAAEEAVIQLLLINNLLTIPNDDSLLEKRPIRTRSANNFVDKHLGFKFDQPINVYRILDSNKEKFTLNTKNKKIFKDKLIIRDIITAPEIEILIIIANHHYDKYSKISSKTKPSEYCKQILKLSRVKEYDFVFDYFSDKNFLLETLKKYDQIKGKFKSESTLYDLIDSKYK